MSANHQVLFGVMLNWKCRYIMLSALERKMTEDVFSMFQLGLTGAFAL
jgi:hypothetical protein